VFAQGIADSFDIDDNVTSPTFTIMNEYSGKLPFYHLDFYRLNSPSEFIWLDFKEMLDGEGVSIIEWGERAGDELPKRTLRVIMEFIDNDRRSITITRIGVQK